MTSICCGGRLLVDSCRCQWVLAAPDRLSVLIIMCHRVSYFFFCFLLFFPIDFLSGSFFSSFWLNFFSDQFLTHDILYNHDLEGMLQWIPKLYIMKSSVFLVHEISTELEIRHHLALLLEDKADLSRLWTKWYHHHYHHYHPHHHPHHHHPHPTMFIGVKALMRSHWLSGHALGCRWPSPTSCHTWGRGFFFFFFFFAQPFLPKDATSIS